MRRFATSDSTARLATAEQPARTEIDRLRAAAGWAVQDFKAADLHASRGVAPREFELNPGYGTTDFFGNFLLDRH